MPLQLSRLAFHASPGEPGSPSAVTVLVGPNNSGKSLALREIASWAAGANEDRQVVAELDVEWPTAQDIETALTPFKTAPREGETNPGDAFLVAPFRLDGSENRVWLQRPTLGTELLQGSASSWLRQTVLQHFTARLDGRARFALMGERPWQDQQDPPKHHLAALFKNNDLRQRVREIVTAAFPGRYFVIDPTAMNQFRVRMSDRPSADEAEERNWDERAQQFHGAAQLIDDLSDGVICFTGLVAAAISLQQQILLVDEPEAFLHPPLARLLGSSLGSLADERGATLIAATHSADFLMGCIGSGADTTIVRLTYEQGQGGARVLPPTGLKPLIQDPLLRSTKALTGLFHRGVIVGESDHDRSFYDEINRRLLSVRRGARDVFFANAQNWQTVPRVVAPLRKLGVPAAAVVDLDTLAGAKGEWAKFYEAMSLDASSSASLEARRVEVAGYLKAMGKTGGQLRCKQTGLAGLRSGERAKAKKLLEDLSRYGVFVVPAGELESWLPALKVPRKSKGSWIVSMFRALGSSPTSSSYVKPKSGDVWRFLDGIGTWIDDPARAGLP